MRAPTVEGVLTLSQVGIALDSDVAPFEQVDARLVWKDDRIRVERLEGLMGYAPFAIQGDGRASCRRGCPRSTSRCAGETPS